MSEIIARITRTKEDGIYIASLHDDGTTCIQRTTLEYAPIESMSFKGGGAFFLTILRASV